MARRKKKTGKRVVRWTADERKAWALFLKGDVMFPPSQRPIAAVVKRLRGFDGLGKTPKANIMPSFEALPDKLRHAVGVAALDMLRHLPHTRDNQLRDLSEAICRFAAGDVAFLIEKPETSELAKPSRAPELFELPETPKNAKHAIFDLPDETLHAAIIAARAAIRLRGALR